MALTDKYVRADAAGSGSGNADTTGDAYTFAEMVTAINGGASAGYRYNIKAGTYSLGDVTLTSNGTQAVSGTYAEEQIYSTLSTASAVTDLVGTRIYPLVAPQSAEFPYLVYQRVSSDITQTLAADTRLDFVRIQIACWSKDHAESITIADTVRTALTNIARVESIIHNYDEGSEDTGEAGAYGTIVECVMIEGDS